jgi:hypothetical protein
MEALNRLREAMAQAGLRTFGISTAQDRVFEGEVRGALDQGPFMRLPIAPGPAYPQQDANGEPYFMLGLSSLDGTDAF